MKLFVEKLSQNEKQLILNEYAIRDKMDYYKWTQTTPEEKEKVLNNTPIIFRAEEKYICPNENKWEERYYITLFDKKRTIENIEEISINLLEGFEWVFKYYTVDCPDWKWKYRFHYPPLLIDLVRFIPNNEQDLIIPRNSGNNPFTPQLQLSYVLPPIHHYLLKEENRKYLREKCPHFYAKEIIYLWAFCRYFFEAHILLPEISIDELEKVENEMIA